MGKSFSRPAWLFLFIIPFLVLHSHAEPFSIRPLLLTAFEPFGGRSENLSLEVAEKIKNELESGRSPASYQVNICLLPVVYDRAAQVAQQCFEGMNPKPVTVVSLGEGSCSIHLETAAHNLDRAPGFPDNAGEIRANSPIDSHFPMDIGFTFPVSELYCAIPSVDLSRVLVSHSPGGFVCNNTAFHLAHYFSETAAPHAVPYTFIHIPPKGCRMSDPKANGHLVAQMIEQALRRTPEQMPTTREAVIAHLDLISKNPSTSACQIDFYNELKNTWLR